MKARLVPVHFKSGMDEQFRTHLAIVKDLLSEDAEVLPPVALGSRLPPADAAVFPQLIGEAFSQLDSLKRLPVPALVLTSDFGTVNMWDWEIVTFMKSLGMKVFTPYDLALTRTICRSLALRREMREVKFLVFQDRPGVGGEQPEIFKRFWWWEDRANEVIREEFGIRVVRKSYEKLGAAAKAVSDADARAALKDRVVPAEGVGERPMLSAVKLYLALKRELDADPAIQGAGINCLNESAFSDTTPCLAWDLLYQERRLAWACEGDTLSLLTTYLLERAVRAPVMMSNLYPFLMGGAALKHEKIDRFPDVPEPENHLLMVHCGYFGEVPRAFCESWTLRPKALAIVNENATVIDGRMKTGPMTLAKLHPELKSVQVIDGELEGYSQYPGSDCRNESAFSDTTPCLAWDLLYQERRLAWACEGDTLSLLTTYLLERALRAPVMMSNLYPFLMGGAALKHEKIDKFPDVPEPENHLLMVHCGYFGEVPRAFCESWTLRPKALAIVNENATVIDGRMRTGPMTLAKLHPELKSVQVIDGELEGYSQYPGSDCRNGALLKVRDGRALMKAFYSHHYCIMTGRHATEVELMARVMDLGVEAL